MPFSQQKQTIGDLDCIVTKSANCETPKAIVILCHGFGAPGSDLVGLYDEMIGRLAGGEDIVFIFPAAPIELDPLFDSRAWWMVDIEKIQQMMMQGETRELRSAAPPELEDRREKLIKLIDLCRVDFKVDPSNIIIGGFSQGAMLTTDVALNYREPLGGLIIWSGNLINESVWRERSNAQKPLKIIQSHGRLDPILPMIGAEVLRDLLSDSGHDVRFCEFNGAHQIPLEAIVAATQLIAEVVEPNTGN